MRVVVTGAGGMLARALVRQLVRRGFETMAFDRRTLDVTHADAVRSVLQATRPHAVIQCAAWTDVDGAEDMPDAAHAVNCVAAAVTADVCRSVGARFVYPSTDYVFDGTASAPYPPAHPTAPLNEYGRSKLAGEQAALEAGDTLVVRTSWLYGPGGRNFVSTILQRARTGASLRVVDDQHGVPTTTRDLADMILTLLQQAAPAGIWHATNAGHTTWYGLAAAALEAAGMEADIAPCPSAEFPRPAARPAWSVLDCSATWEVTGEPPHWRDALQRSLSEGLNA